MRTYEDDRRTIVEFMREKNMNACDLVRVAKDLCRCVNCKHYVQHYDKNGAYVDFGHCIRNKANRATRPYSASCGSWDCE